MGQTEVPPSSLATPFNPLWVDKIWLLELQANQAPLESSPARLTGETVLLHLLQVTQGDTPQSNETPSRGRADPTHFSDNGSCSNKRIHTGVPLHTSSTTAANMVNKHHEDQNIDHHGEDDEASPRKGSVRQLPSECRLSNLCLVPPES